MMSRGALFVLGLALALSGGPVAAAEQLSVAEVLKLGELPPPPEHTWQDIKADLADNRVHGNGLVRMPIMRAYLNGLYGRIKASANVPDWPGEVWICADTTLNAHASASGNVYLNIGLLASAQSEDEVFGVLAHEFGHIYLNHQAAYEANATSSSAALVGLLAVKLAHKKLPTSGAWGAGDSIGLVYGVARENLLPAWQRDVEQQADLFAMTLSLKEEYSYPSGYKAFLERLATIEAREPVVPGGASGIKTHADAQQREAVLTEAVLPLMRRPRPAPRVAPWRAQRDDPQNAEVFGHFAMREQIERLQQAGRNDEAMKVARVAASGATEGDATMLLLEWDLARKMGIGAADQFAILSKNFSWDEPAWSLVYQAALIAAAVNEPMATGFLEKAFAALGEPGRAMADMLVYYQRTNSPWRYNALYLRCTLNGRFRDTCFARTQTPAQKAQLEAQQKSRQQELENNFKAKLDRIFNLK